jgi:hypothetical protein
MYNEIKSGTSEVIDVGSKFCLFNKLCNLRGWVQPALAAPANHLFDQNGQVYRQILHLQSTTQEIDVFFSYAHASKVVGVPVRFCVRPSTSTYDDHYWTQN